MDRLPHIQDPDPGPLLRRLLEETRALAHPPEVLYGITGATCGQSVSPRLHNAAYAQHGIRAHFLPFPADSLLSLWGSLRSPASGGKTLALGGIPVRGFTVLAPLKAESLQLADEVSPLAARVGFANILYEHQGRWIADSSDEVVCALLQAQLGRLRGQRVAVLGCGGAGMAIAAALQDQGARVLLVNRGVERARLASQRLGLPWAPLAGFDPGGLDVLVHATPVGRFDEACPLSPDLIPRSTLVIDLVYRPTPTPLTRALLARGDRLIDGHQVLHAEVLRQLELMTGRHFRGSTELDTRRTAGREAAEQGASRMEFEHGLPPARAQLMRRVEALAARFAPRADRHDREASFPKEDFEDLHREGLLAASLPEEQGGLGVGPLNPDVYTLWMMTRAFARVDLSLARCWEGHQNSLVIIRGLGNDEQRARWLEGVVQRGEIWVAWSGEPTTRAPGEKQGVGTQLTRVPGGYRISGTKVFATSATDATWAILLISLAGPGGARHTQGSPADVLMMACDLRDPSVEIDRRWWDPVGMRGTASHRVCFHDTFIPDSDLIGRPGQYLLEDWQTRFIPHYAASFLGAAEGALDYARSYLTAQNKTADPFIQQHLGRMQMNVHTGHLWLRHVASLWEQGANAEARVAGSRARYLIEHLTEETFQSCIRACGARCFIRPSALERAWRDVNFYFRHDNDDHILAMLGRSTLGIDVDASFFRSEPGKTKE